MQARKECNIACCGSGVSPLLWSQRSAIQPAERRAAAQQAVRHFCLVRDARKVVLKTQWTRWEAAHHRRITKDIQYRGTAVASEPKGSVIRDCDFTLVSDTIKTHVCKLYAPPDLAGCGGLCGSWQGMPQPAGTCRRGGQECRCEGLLRVCRHLQAKLQEWHRFRKEADRERERLRGAHGLHVIMEKCFLLGLNPARNEEYLAAMARVDADTPAVPPFRVIETPLVVSRLHRQGARSICGCDQLRNAWECTNHLCSVRDVSRCCNSAREQPELVETQQR